jgi:hypothetical protein
MGGRHALPVGPAVDPRGRISGATVFLYRPSNSAPIAADYRTLVESRPCVTAEVVQELRGRFRVRFADGTERWVAPTPDVWRHRPQPGDRVSVTWGGGA